MSDYKPRHYRIYTRTTQRNILHVGDALDIGKIHVDGYQFQRGKGASANAHAYISVDELRPILHDLARRHLMERHQFIGGSVNGAIVARVAIIEPAGADAKNPVRISIENGPGIRQASGLIQPAWWGKANSKEGVDRITMLLDWNAVRQLAYATLEHIAAHAAATYHERIANATWQPNPDAVQIAPDGQARPANDQPALDYDSALQRARTAVKRFVATNEQLMPDAQGTPAGALLMKLRTTVAELGFDNADLEMWNITSLLLDRRIDPSARLTVAEATAVHMFLTDERATPHIDALWPVGSIVTPATPQLAKAG